MRSCRLLAALIALPIVMTGCLWSSIDEGPPRTESYLYTGVVVDSSTNMPIAGARVYGDGGATVTDSEGRFSFTSQYPEPRSSWLVMAQCYELGNIEWNGREGTARLTYHGRTTLRASLKLTVYGLESTVRDGNITFRNIETGKIYSDPTPSVSSSGSGVYVEIPVDPGTYRVESAWVIQGFTGHRYSATFANWERRIEECETYHQTFTINVMP